MLADYKFQPVSILDMTMTVPTSTIVGALACQKNSYLKTLNATVIKSFDYTLPPTSQDKQNKEKKGKNDKKDKPVVVKAIELSDTVLFPEGGGQPYDHGKLILEDNSEIAITKVLREKLTALHIADTELEAGTPVRIEIDWKRRYDHMQQHSGQHLVSAVFDQYDLETLSWSLGDVLCYIEIERKVEDLLLEEINAKIQQYIIDDLPYNVLTPNKDGSNVDTSALPDDYDLSNGILRVVCIGDIDHNACCGTHLASTREVQSVSILHQVGVRGGHSRVYFVSGARSYKYLRYTHNLLKTVAGNHLSCQIEEVDEKVEALNLNYRKSTSREQNLLKEIASNEASKLYEKFLKGSEVGFVYRQDTSDLLTFAFKELVTLSSKNDDVDVSTKQTVVLINGEYPTGGTVKVLGPKAEEIQKELKSKISNLKGGGKGSSFQGKIEKYGKGELEDVLEYLGSLSV